MRDSLEQDRSTSPLLLIGIFFLPFIFAFFTLRKNHSLLIKLLSFSWLSFLLGYIVAAQTHLSQEKSAAPVSKTIVEKERSQMMASLLELAMSKSLILRIV